MHNGGAEGHALLPSSRQTAGDLVLLAFETRKRQYPPDFFCAFMVGNTVYAGKKVQVVFNGKVVVQRELLGHVSDALPHNSRSHATLARQLYLAFRWREEAAKHFYGGRLACAVGSEQAIDLAISNLQVHVRDSREIAEPPGEVGCADSYPSLQVVMRVTARKRLFVDDLAQATEFRDKHVFQCRFILMYLGRGNARGTQLFVQKAFGLVRFVHQQVQAVTETLHVENFFSRTAEAGNHPLGFAQLRSAEFQTSGAQTGSQLGGRTHLLDQALMH